MLDPDFGQDHPLRFASGIRVLHTHFFDDDDLGRQEVPVMTHIEAVCDFLRSAMSTPSPSRLLVHCHAGASRSPAIAFVAYCLMGGTEEKAFEKMLTLCNKPWPSENVVQIADALLDRNGRMTTALRLYQNRHPYRLRAYQRINGKRNIFEYG